MAAEKLLVREGNHYSFTIDPDLIESARRMKVVNSWSFGKDETPAQEAVPSLVGVNGHYRYFEVPKKDLDPEVERQYGLDVAVLTVLLTYPEIDESVFRLLL